MARKVYLVLRLLAVVICVCISRIISYTYVNNFLNKQNDCSTVAFLSLTHKKWWFYVVDKSCFSLSFPIIRAYSVPLVFVAVPPSLPIPANNSFSLPVALFANHSSAYVLST